MIATRRQPARALAALAVLISSVAAVGCATAAPAPPPSLPSSAAAAITTDLALQTFDSAWSRVHNSYYDPAFRGIDWPGIHAELRPRAAAATTIGALRQVMNEMLGRLGESHFAIIPREQVDPLDDDDRGSGRPEADVGLHVRWVDGELVIVRVEPGSAADAAGVRAGWIVDAIDTREVARWKSAIAAADSGVGRRGLVVGSVLAAHGALRGPDGSPVSLRLRDGTGNAIEREVARRRSRGEPVQFGNLPMMYAHLEHERRDLGAAGCVGVIRFNVWMVPLSAAFNRAVDSLSRCSGMIIDLRGNPGGVAGMVMGTSGAFLDTARSLGVMRTRQGELRFVSNPRRVGADGRAREPYRGPLAVLIDDQSMSTSEVFAGGMQAIGRARVFGVTSPGYALPAMMLRLPTGDVLYHAIANLTDPNGRRIEGVGVVPDVPAPPDRTDLLMGRDAAMQSAIDWILTQPRDEAAGESRGP